MTFSISLYVSFVFFVLVLLLFLPLGWVAFPLSVDLGGGLLSVSILDLVQSLGSTEDWVPCFGHACDLFYFFLSFFIVF